MKSPAILIKMSVFFWIGMFVLQACHDPQTTQAGAGVNTGNTITGTVIDSAGSGLPGVWVNLLPLESSPEDWPDLPKEWILWTNENGEYRFENVPAGDFNIQGTLFPPSRKRTGAVSSFGGFLIQQISLKESLKNVQQTFKFEPRRIGAHAKLQIDLNQFNVTNLGTLYLPGTKVHLQLEELHLQTDKVWLNEIPAGVFPSVIFQSNGAMEVLNSDPIQMKEGDVRTLGLYQNWEKMTTVSIDVSEPFNQSASYIPITLSLESLGIDFTQFQPDGADLRVVNDRQIELDFQIQEWNPLLPMGKIQLRIDSLQAQDSSLVLHLYYGNSKAVSAEPTLFVGPFGYQGVWIFNEFNEQDGIFPDASGTNGMELRGALDVYSMVNGEGRTALYFSDSLDQLVSKNYLPPSSTLTLSLWFKTSAQKSGKLIGNEGEPNPYDRHIWMDEAGLIHFGVFPHEDPAQRTLPSDPNNPDSLIYPGVYRVISSLEPYNDGLWHHVAATVSLEGMKLYVDGLVVAHDAATTEVQNNYGYWVVGGGKLASWPGISREEGQSFFEGLIDDVMVLDRDVGSKWIELYYKSEIGQLSILEE